MISNTPAPSDALLNINEAHQQLGIGRSTLYRLLKARAIASVHVGARHFVRQSDLDAYVAGLATTITWERK